VSGDRGQAMIEFALGLPLVLVSVFIAFGLLDATATQAGVEAGVRRAAQTLVGSNDDDRAVAAALRSAWLAGQDVRASFDPPQTTLRCAGTRVRVSLSAPGHLGFLLPLPRRWSAVQTIGIEDEGSQAGACAVLPK